MLLVDLPSAREAASGAPRVAFVPPHDPEKLKEKMKALVLGNEGILSPAPVHPVADPKVSDWAALLRLLLPDE